MMRYIHILKTILRNKLVLIPVLIVLGIFCIAFFYLFSYKAPYSFPDPAIVVISEGESLTSISKKLEDKHIINSPFWFANFVIFFEHERRVVQGEYYFEHPMSVYEIARRVTSGDYHTDQLKTTIPEGSSIFDISMILKKNYPKFDAVHFLTLARNREGYLFPDTYLFGADVQPEKIINLMSTTFDKKIQDTRIQELIKTYGKPLQDVVTMASILEGEARQMRTRQIVAGILWERLKRGMPLQVDATFKYINGKSTEDLTVDDLKIDSPYNTYVYKGLPPTAISNPGIGSIEAAVTPIETEYLYFLTDNEGNMHYAKDYEEHVKNQKRYLK